MDKNYRALELDKILEMVAKETTCEDGAALARSIEPVYTAGFWRRRTRPLCSWQSLARPPLPA